MSYEPNSSANTFPPPDHPILAEFANPPPRSRSGGWLIGLVVCLVFGVACALAAVWLIPRELQQWRIASAEEQRLNGDAQGAMQKLDEDIKKNPRDVELRRTKAQWLLEDKQYKQALTEIDQVISWQPGDVRAYALRAQIHHSLGEHAKAVEDYKRLLEFDSVSAGPGRPEVLNGLAYGRALANIEVNEGLVDIAEAMRMEGENFQMLDTRGFLYYRAKDFDRALKDLDNAVKFAEDYYSAIKQPVADRRVKKRLDQAAAQTLGVLHYHRGLVHEARNDAEKAEADYRRVRELGLEPSESLF